MTFHARVFGAWLNLTDLKAGNTLDTLISENGRSVVRHYLQDVGSTFGTGALVGRRETFEQGEPEYRGGGQVEIVTLEGVEWSAPPERDEAGDGNEREKAEAGRRRRNASRDRPGESVDHDHDGDEDEQVQRDHRGQAHDKHRHKDSKAHGRAEANAQQKTQ